MQDKNVIGVVNDDGVESILTKKLINKLREEGHEVISVLPNECKSGTGYTFTGREKIRVDDVSSNGMMDFVAHTTPAGCSIVLNDICKREGIKLDLVISGINDFPNFGLSEYDSGTVGAAKMACVYGYPSISVSINEYDFRDRPQDEKEKMSDEYVDMFMKEILEVELIGISLDNKNIRSYHLPAIPLRHFPSKRIKVVEIMERSNLFWDFEYRKEDNNLDNVDGFLLILEGDFYNHSNYNGYDIEVEESKKGNITFIRLPVLS